MRQRGWATSTKSLIGVSSGRVDRKYLLGSTSPAGHSMSSHCSGRRRALPVLPPAWRTRTAAKRPFSVSLVPSRQLMFWNARLGRDCANALTLMGCSAAVRLGITGGGATPPYGLGGGGGTVWVSVGGGGWGCKVWVVAAERQAARPRQQM